MPGSGTADLLLHSGHAPGWLFERMEELGEVMTEAVIEEYGRKEFLGRLSDPYWFQAFGCVLGFDWHSSGLTTTTMGALKEALSLKEHGVAVAGGKGNTSRQTPAEVEGSGLTTANAEKLKQSSRMSASVDNSCVQDSYSLYHHTIAFTENGDWAVVQQGMNDSHARRYHWFSETAEDMVVEPQSAICADDRRDAVLNLSSSKSSETREISVDLVQDDPDHLERFTKKGQSSLESFISGKELRMPDHHWLREEDLSPRTLKNLETAYEVQPSDYSELLRVDGIGKKSLRALGLIAELVYGSENDWDDPAKYAYAHGGKDGAPYPVNRKRYDRSIETVRQVVEGSEIGRKEKKKALRRLGDLEENT